MLVAAGAACAAAVDRWGSDGATAGGRCGITGVCGTAAGADDCSAEVAGRWDDGCRRLRRHTERGPTEQAVLMMMTLQIICVWSVVTHTDAQGQKCV